MKTRFENATLFLDNNIISMLDILKLARQTQLKNESKASKKYFKNTNEKKTKSLADKLADEQVKTYYLEYLIKNLEKEI